MCGNQVAIAPNFAPGGVENGWKYTIPPLLDSPDLLVVDIRPDGTLGAQSYSAVFDKDFTCRKSLFSKFYHLSSPIIMMKVMMRVMIVSIWSQLLSILVSCSCTWKYYCCWFTIAFFISLFSSEYRK